jgi:glycogen synthase
MKVLHLLDHSAPQHSGYTFRSLAILRSLIDLGVEILPMTSVRHGPSGGPTETAEGVLFYRTDVNKKSWWSGLPFFGEILMTAVRVKELAIEHRCALIHAHSPPLHGVSAWIAAKQLGLPFTYEIRAFWEDAAVDVGKTSAGSMRYKLTRALETWVCKRANHVFPICQGLRDDLYQRGIEANKLTIIPNAVEAHRFEPLNRDVALRKQLGIADDMFTFGFFGSFYHYEGLQFLCRAVPLLAKANPKFKIVLAGTGEAEQEIRTLMAATDIAKHVIYVGKIPNTEIKRYYACVDAMIYPRLSSRLTELTTPLKPLESMAMHRLVLATNIGGHRELISDGKTGLMFEAGSEQACAQVMLQAIQLGSQERQKLLEQADYFVRHERTWNANAKRYIPDYTRLIERKS